MMGIMKRGLSPAEQMGVIGRLAQRQALSNPEFTPIKLILKENKAFNISSADVYKMYVTSNQRGKDQRNVQLIKCSEARFRERVEFVEDPESQLVFCYIPKTEHNMNLLASHYGELWDIENPEIEAEVHKMSLNVKKVRDTSLAHLHSAGQIPKHTDPKEERMKMLEEENATLKAREGAGPQKAKRTIDDDIQMRALQKRAIQAEQEKAQLEQLLAEYQAKTSEPVKEKKNNGNGKDTIPDAIKIQIKEMINADTEFVEQCKAENPKKWHFTKLYRQRRKELEKQLMEESVANN